MPFFPLKSDRGVLGWESNHHCLQRRFRERLRDIWAEYLADGDDGEVTDVTLRSAGEAASQRKLIEIFAQKKRERQLQIPELGTQIRSLQKEHIKKGKAKTN